MSTSFQNLREATLADLERLIPGDMATAEPDRKKPPRSVRAFERIPASAEETSGYGAGAMVKISPSSRSGNALGLLMPGPLQSRRAFWLLRAIAADFALIGLNWLVVGALLVPSRTFFPRVRMFDFATGSPWSLMGIAFLHAALITLVGYTEGLYEAGRSGRHARKALWKAILLATFALGLGYALQGVAWTATVLFSGAGWLHFGALWSWRYYIQKRLRRDDSQADVRNVLIVDAGKTGRRLAAYLGSHPAAGRAVYGLLDDESPLGNGVIGRVKDLARLARTGFVDEVILAAPRNREKARQIVREARRLRLDVEVIPELFGCGVAEHEADHWGDLPVICLHAERLPVAGLVLKRCVDVMGATFALVILSPLLLAIAALIKLDSPGMVLYRAQRAGRKGRLFRCYKFRTMVSNAEARKDGLRAAHNERSGPIFKIADDPRITRLGKWLRRYSLDELPQIWNVLKGEMSLVGPRPHPVDDYAAYEIGHLARLDVTPGITGLWQVTARRDASFERGMELDREYIRTWSLRSDLRILAKTVLAVVRGSGQ